MTLHSIFNATRYVTHGVECVIVHQPATAWGYLIPIEHVHLAATTGVGIHRPGTLVCGYEAGKNPGWVVGYFEPTTLIHLLESITVA